MGRKTKKTESLPGALEMLILKTLERNAEPMQEVADFERGDPARGAAGVSLYP